MSRRWFPGCRAKAPRRWVELGLDSPIFSDETANLPVSAAPFPAPIAALFPEDAGRVTVAPDARMGDGGTKPFGGW